MAEIKAAGASAVFIEADLVTTGSIPAAIARAVASYGRLDLAFNNAGVVGGGPIETLDEATCDRIVAKRELNTDASQPEHFHDRRA